MTSREFWEQDKPRRRRKRYLIFRLSDRLWPQSWHPFARDVLTGAVLGTVTGLAVAVLLWLILH